MNEDTPLIIKNGVVYAYGLRLLKDPETMAREQNERMRRLLARIKEYGRSCEETPEDRRAKFKLIQGEKR